jgi:hypothetical protein
MATRSDRYLQNAVIKTKIVDTSQTATKGKGLIRSTDDDHVDDGGANANVYCVALETKAAGEFVEVALLTGGAIVPVLVGTGGATQGAYAVTVSDGWTDQTLGGGTTVVYIGGKFTQTGVAGDIVGMAVGQFAGVKA